MPLSRLELVSYHGDQTLRNVKFVFQVGTELSEAMESGIRFIEGKAVVSANLTQGVGQAGHMAVCALPQNFFLGYGVFTTAYLDRALKRVSGAPLRYAAGRTELAFYMSPDTETTRIHIEAEIANGYAIERRPQFLLEPKYVVGTF